MILPSARYVRANALPPERPDRFALHENAPARSTTIVAFQSANDLSVKAASFCEPALLIRMSTEPKCSIAVADSRLTSASRATSPSTTSAVPPCAATSAASVRAASDAWRA